MQNFVASSNIVLFNNALISILFTKCALRKKRHLCHGHAKATLLYVEKGEYFL
jgi:hypothetical protein